MEMPSSVRSLPSKEKAKAQVQAKLVRVLREDLRVLVGEVDGRLSSRSTA